MHSGLFVALKVPIGPSLMMALEGGELPEDLHVTLFYLKGLNPEQKETVAAMVNEVLPSMLPIHARMGGIGRFSASDTSDGKDVIYVSVDSPELTKARAILSDMLAKVGIDTDVVHGYTPHVTLKYVHPLDDAPFRRIIPFDVSFTEAIVDKGSPEPEIPPLAVVFGQRSMQ